MQNKLLQYSGLIIFGVCLSQPVSAGCSRDDVDYYLEKGFSHDQIAQICSDGSKQAAKTATNSAKNTHSTSLDNPITYLVAAIEASNVRAEEAAILYSRNICSEYGIKTQYGRVKKLCVDVDFHIAFENLKILKSSKKAFIFSKNEIVVEGTIKQTVQKYESYTKPEKRVIDKLYKDNQEARIPLRSGTDIDRVKKILESLSQ